MAKTVLSFEPDFDFRIIGISCHAKDYRLIWTINRELDFNLRKTNDHEIVTGKKDARKSSFSQFIWDDEEQMKSYTLFSNRSQGGLLVPEMKQADFLLILKGNFSNTDISELKEKINSLDVVLAAFEIQVDSLKSKLNLIF